MLEPILVAKRPMDLNGRRAERPLNCGHQRQPQNLSKTSLEINIHKLTQKKE